MIGMKDYIKHQFHMFKHNLPTLILFTVIYTFISEGAITVVTFLLFRLELWISGLTYLGNDNFTTFFLCPLNWPVFIVHAATIAYIVMIEVSGFIGIFHASHNNKKLRLRDAFGLGLAAARKVFIPRNWLLILYLLLLLPMFGGFIITSSGMGTLPGFILDYIFANKLLMLGYLAAMVALFIVCVRWMFSMHIMTLEGKSFIKGCEKSKRLFQKRFLKSLLIAVVVILIMVAIFVAVALAVCGLTAVISYAVGGVDLMESNTYNALLVVVAIILLFLPAFSMNIISGLYYKWLEEKKEDEILDYEELQKTSLRGKRFVVVVICFAAAVASTIIIQIVDSSQAPYVLLRPMVFAHRGDSVRAPENSMPAFELAIEEGAEGIELDVHQTSDGVIVVTHDDSLKRIAGDSRCVHEVTYEELSQMDVGSWFSEKFAGLRVATLDEVLDLCEDKVYLQIEIKPTEYDQDIEQCVADIIHDHEMEDQCMIISLKKEPLEKMEEIAPDIRLGYCLALGAGDIESIPFADAITIEESNVSEEMVRKIHDTLKSCFVWTINDEKSVQMLVDIGMDAIVTDDPVMMDEALDDCFYTGGFMRYVRGLIGGY